MPNIYRGDDTEAFGGSFITITLVNGEEITITKAVFRCGIIIKEFENPVFPLTISLSRKETLELKDENECFLAVYDSNGLKRTCEGSLKFNTNQRRV